MKFSELNESVEFEYYKIMDTYLSELEEDEDDFNEREQKRMKLLIIKDEVIYMNVIRQTC